MFVGLFPALAGAAVAGGAWWYLKRRTGENSAPIDQPLSEVGGVDVAGWDDTGKLSWLAGVPYWYGKGAPSTPPTEALLGLDCGGLVQVALVALGELSPTAADRGAAALADDCDPIEAGQQRPGDLAIYPGHVALVISEPDEQGDSAVLSASGGDSTVKGNNPSDYVRVFSTALYRDDFVCFGRLKADKRGW